jgi:hypothetical protein
LLPICTKYSESRHSNAPPALHAGPFTLLVFHGAGGRQLVVVELERRQAFTTRQAPVVEL